MRGASNVSFNVMLNLNPSAGEPAHRRYGTLMLNRQSVRSLRCFAMRSAFPCGTPSDFGKLVARRHRIAGAAWA